VSLQLLVGSGRSIVAGFLNYLSRHIKNPGASTGVFSSKPVKVTQLSYDDDDALEQLLLLSYDDDALVQLSLQLFYDDDALEQLLLLSYDDALEQLLPSYDGALVLLSLLLFFFF
jgi:hypothetical protein